MENDRATTPDAAPPRRILLVDDDRDFANSAAHCLRSRGYQVVSTNNAEEACEAARRFDAHVALLDICLGNESGISLIAELKKIRPDILCLMITAYADLENAIQALQHGAYDYLRKPVSPPAVFAALDRCFERLRLEREKAALEAQLRQAQKLEAVGQLAAGVAHDLNNVFMAIMNYARAACTSPFQQDVAIRAFDEIVDVTERATGLTRSLLTFSRKASAEKSPVPLGQAVAKSMRLLRSLLPAAIEVTTEISSSHAGLWIEADVTQLQQVVLNLAINARDAMPNGGILRVTVRHEPVDAADVLSAVTTRGKGAAVLIVEDTGVGMTDEVRARIFEPFFTTKPREQGTGLGLAVVHGIMSDHQARIEVDSKEGRGTRISIMFPCCDAPASADSASASDRIERAVGETILLAEDNEQIRAIMTTALRSAGYDVIEASDGVAAVSAFEECRDRVRLLVLDLDLPKRDGLACLTQMRHARPDLPAVIVSGAANQNLGRHLDSRTRLLRKPFLMSDFLQCVSHALTAPDRRTSAASWVIDGVF